MKNLINPNKYLSHSVCNSGMYSLAIWHMTSHQPVTLWNAWIKATCFRLRLSHFWNSYWNSHKMMLLYCKFYIITNISDTEHPSCADKHHVSYCSKTWKFCQVGFLIYSVPVRFCFRLDISHIPKLYLPLCLLRYSMNNYEYSLILTFLFSESKYNRPYSFFC